MLIIPLVLAVLSLPFKIIGFIFTKLPKPILVLLAIALVALLIYGGYCSFGQADPAAPTRTT